jgi:hypothetical protein
MTAKKNASQIFFAKRTELTDKESMLLSIFLSFVEDAMACKYASSYPQAGLPAEEPVRVVPLFRHIHVEAVKPALLGRGRVHRAVEAVQKRR